MALIEHFPYEGIKKNINKKIELNIDLSIITSFTSKNDAKLINQLEENNIKYINAAEGLKEFKKAFKPIYYNNVLKDVTTEYVLIIDSYDSIIYNIDNMPSCLNHYDKDMIYGAWFLHFPTFIDFDFDVPKNNSLKYLNSGVFFGKTEEVKKYYSLLSEYIDSGYNLSNNYLKDYEQYWIYKYLSNNKDLFNNLGIDFDELLVKNNPDIII